MCWLKFQWRFRTRRSERIVEHFDPWRVVQTADGEWWAMGRTRDGKLVGSPKPKDEDL